MLYGGPSRHLSLAPHSQGPGPWLAKKHSLEGAPSGCYPQFCPPGGLSSPFSGSILPASSFSSSEGIETHE